MLTNYKYWHFYSLYSADQLPDHMNFSQYIAANVPSLKDFIEESTKLQNGFSALKALCYAMFSLLRYYVIVSFKQLLSYLKKKERILNWGVEAPSYLWSPTEILWNSR